MDGRIEELRVRIAGLENTVLRLESLIRTIESGVLRDSMKTTAAIDSLKRSQTGPGKNLGV